MYYTIKQILFKSVLSFLVLINFLSASEALAQFDQPEAKGVSLIQLISNPSEFDGELVRVIGYCRLAFEGDSLYFHREDFEHIITKNAVWLDVSSSISKSQPDLNNRYVIVEGVFDSKHKGHMGNYSGCIKEIRRLEPWRLREIIKKVKDKKGAGGKP